MDQSSFSHLTIDEAVRHHAATRPDDVAVIDPWRILHWAGLNHAADQVAEFLRELGIGPGQRVGWLGPNSAHYPAVLLGVWRRGAVIVGMNSRLPAGELAAAGRVVDLAHVIADIRFASVASEVAPGRTTVVDSDKAPWASLKPADSLPNRADESDEAMVYFTSGSTGVPKAVPLHRGAVESTCVHASVHHFTTHSRSLIVPPAFHVAGATWTNYGLKEGATLVYTEDASPSALVATLEDERITHSIMVPALIHAVVEELRREPRELPDLEHIGYGASPITGTLLTEALGLLDCEFAQVYGMTEAGGGVTFLPAEDHTGDVETAHRLASAGRPGQDVELEVRAEDGTVLPTGMSGELWFRTPCLTRGYIGIDDPTGGVLIDGWLNTRDVGYEDTDGYVYIQGRSDDMIQTGGENVHPRAVEEVLAQHALVADVAVFGVAHEHWGQQVCAAVVPAAPGIVEEDLIAFCRTRLAGYQIPRQMIVLDELPRTATGKVIRSELAKQAQIHAEDLSS